MMAEPITEAGAQPERLRSDLHHLNGEVSDQQPSQLS
jgi:hypothetical protein